MLPGSKYKYHIGVYVYVYIFFLYIYLLGMALTFKRFTNRVEQMPRKLNLTSCFPHLDVRKAVMATPSPLTVFCWQWQGIWFYHASPPPNHFLCCRTSRQIAVDLGIVVNAISIYSKKKQKKNKFESSVLIKTDALYVTFGILRQSNPQAKLSGQCCKN